jgi:hypothetical protein
MRMCYTIYMNPTDRPKEDQNLWNFLFSILFLIVLAGAVYVIYLVRGEFPHQVPVFDAIMMGFAAFRLTRLIVYDKITRWFRELFADTMEVERNGVVYIEVRPFGRGIRHTIHDLLACPWCIGFWGALIISFAYFVFPWAWYVIFFIAMAGLGSLLQISANLIGWKAENAKLDALQR